MRYVVRTLAMVAISSTALAQIRASDPIEHPPYAPEVGRQLAMLVPGAHLGVLKALPSLKWAVNHPETWDPTHPSYMNFFHDDDARGSGEPPLVERPVYNEARSIEEVRAGAFAAETHDLLQGHPSSRSHHHWRSDG
jgi:hypothetical protein